MNDRIIGLAAMAGALLLGVAARGADFSGRFSSADHSTTVELTGDPAGGANAAYTGTISSGNKTAKLTGTGAGDKLNGKLVVDGNSFNFDATLHGDHLQIVTGGATYELDRAAAGATNPFGAAAAAGGNGSATVVIPPEGMELAANDAGKTLFFVQSDCTTAGPAITATGNALKKRLGDSFKLKDGYLDTRNPAGGSATFTATLGGKPVNGVILCGPAKTGVAASVIYSVDNAKPELAAELLAGLPLTGKTTRYDFPDGTGSIELPEHWKSQTQSAADPLVLTGPDHQTMTIGGSLFLTTPDSPLVQMYWNNVASCKRLGMPPPQSPLSAGVVVEAYDRPSVAIKGIVPQVAAISRAHNLPYPELEKITDVKPAEPTLPGGLAESIDSVAVIHDQGKAVRVREMGRYEAVPCGAGAWTLFITAFSAPVEQFDAESLVMISVARSEQVDAKRLKEVYDDRLRQQANVSEEMRRQLDAQFEDGQKKHAAQMAAFDQYNDHWKSQEAAKSAALEPFKEYIRGYAEVQDTKTGETRQVDPADLGKAMDELNHNDPDRFKHVGF